MATGFSRTLEGGHEEIFDYICSRCVSNNKTVEGFHFCTDCGVTYCNPCLENHASFPGLKDHTVLGKDKVNIWVKKKSASVLAEKCGRHDGEVLQMFCGNHDALCCHVCVAMEHRICDNMNYIPIMAKGIYHSKELRTVKQKIEHANTDLGKIKTARKKNIDSLAKSKKNILKSVKDTRKWINQKFDALEKEISDDMEKIYNDCSKGIQTDIKTCDNIRAELAQLKQTFITTGDNESEMFINMKKCQKMIAEGEQLIEKLDKTIYSSIYEFVIDSKVDEVLCKIKRLGQIVAMPPRSDKVQMVSQQSTVQPLYRAHNMREYIVRMKSIDTVECDITGSCLLPDNSILLTDLTNKNVKRLDTSFRVIDHCNITSGPTSVCCISQKEAAVADDSKRIHFVSLASNSMTVIRCLKVKHDCSSVAYDNAQLYVSDGSTKIYVYNKSKSYGFAFSITTSVDKFSGIEQINVSQDGTKLYVAEYYKGLMTFDRKGHLLSTFKDYDINIAFSVFDDGRGSLFVGGSSLEYHSQVFQMDLTGTKKIGVVVDLVDYKNSVITNTMNSKLLLRLNYQDFVCVFDLK